MIPSLDGHRGGLVPKLLDSLERQRYSDFELRVVKGVAPQGRAINTGAREGCGDVLVIIDDDAELADETVLERLMATLDSDPNIGMAGASIVLPPDATPFQRRAAHQFPRLITPEVDEITDSDMACHGCCAIRRQVFDSVGGEREDILRGLDPDLRIRIREAGYRVVLAPHARIYHPLPGDWRALLRTFFRNGYGSAYAQKFQPDATYDTGETVESGGFRPKRGLAYRMLRFPLRLLRALITLRIQRFAAYFVYLIGYAWGLLSAKRLPEANGTAGADGANTS